MVRAAVNDGSLLVMPSTRNPVAKRPIVNFKPLDDECYQFFADRQAAQISTRLTRERCLDGFHERWWIEMGLCWRSSTIRNFWHFLTKLVDRSSMSNIEPSIRRSFIKSGVLFVLMRSLVN